MVDRSRVEWYGPRILKGYKKQVTAGLRAAMRQLRDDVRRDLAGPAHSPPGRPPGEQTGELIHAQVYSVRTKGNSITGQVGALRDHDQAAAGARLAGGFVGRDREGRAYIDPPHPYLAPRVRRDANDIVRHVAKGA